MNYLILAYSVNPYFGSEDGVGWNWVLQYEKNYTPGDRIILLTKQFNEADTRRGFIENGIRHVELVIADVPVYLNWFREKYSMFHHMYYILWQHWAWIWVKKSGIKFDVVHHVTMGDYRIPNEMYKVKDTRVIWGPVGGAQITPKALRCYEKRPLVASFRAMVNRSCSWNPFYRRVIKSYADILCSNKETKQQIESIIGKKVKLLSELALREEHKNLTIHNNHNEVLKIVYVGRLINKKGISFLIDALELMPKNIAWELQIFGDGADRKMIENRVRNSSIATYVKLMGNCPLAQIDEVYKQADIFVLPSLRETGGTVLVEAMAFSIPIVAFDMSFCSELKRFDCGVFVDVNQPLCEIQKDFCSAIVYLAENAEERKRKGQNGYIWVNKELTWEKKYKTIYGNH